MIIFYIILVAVFIVSTLCMFHSNDDGITNVASEVQRMSVVALVTLAIMMSIIGSKPSAIDVYRGDTELEITYRDTIPVDTTVVFKNRK